MNSKEFGAAWEGLPRDRITINSCIRNYYSLSPIVRNVIYFHSSYPLNRFRVSAKSKQICLACGSILDRLKLAEYENNYEIYGDFKADVNLLTLSKEYWLLGEVFPLIRYNENNFCESITFINPDSVFINRDMVYNTKTITLRADPLLKKLIESDNPADIEVTKKLPKELVDEIKKNGNIPLGEEYISSIIRLTTPYDIRGTSIILATLKDLVLYDKLREIGDPTDRCVDDIYRGLLFSKDLIYIIYDTYMDYRRRITNWIIHDVFVPIIRQEFPVDSEEIIITWNDINMDDLKSHLWPGSKREV